MSFFIMWYCHLMHISIIKYIAFHDFSSLWRSIIIVLNSFDCFLRKFTPFNCCPSNLLHLYFIEYIYNIFKCRNKLIHFCLLLFLLNAMLEYLCAAAPNRFINMSITKEMMNMMLKSFLIHNLQYCNKT